MYYLDAQTVSETTGQPQDVNRCTSRIGQTLHDMTLLFRFDVRFCRTLTLAEITVKKGLMFFVLLGCFWLASASCRKSPTAPSPARIDLSVEWQTASAQSQGIHAGQLQRAFDNARQINGLWSLLVVRNAKIVGEEYYAGNHADSLNHVRSVTKSVISALIGIALEKGLIKSVDQPIGDFLLPVVDSLEAQKSRITIRQLLTMTSGLQWHEIGGLEYSSWIRASDHLKYVLQKPLVATPGQQFNYNSGAVHVLSVILTQASGMSTQAFADQVLFAPLGITERRWQQLSGGYFNGGAGLQLRPRDMAKLGWLMLQNGFSGTQDVVPSAWVSQTLQVQQNLGFSFGGLRRTHYGFLWWLDHGYAREVWLAWGYGGQFVYCVPALNLVVVTTADWRLSDEATDVNEKAILNLIANDIVPAVKIVL